MIPLKIGSFRQSIEKLPILIVKACPIFCRNYPNVIERFMKDCLLNVFLYYIKGFIDWAYISYLYL